MRTSSNLLSLSISALACVLVGCCTGITSAKLLEWEGVFSTPAYAAAEDEIRGVVRSQLQADVSTDLDVPVTTVAVRAGERFAKGDLLVAFDCARYRAALRSASATRTEMQLDVKSNELLSKRGAGGLIDLEVARARLEKARGDVEVLQAKMRDCVLHAPFDGRVVDVLTRPFERPPAGKPFILILGDAALEIELIVPSAWLRWLKTGSTFSFAIDETGQRLDARVVRIGAKVDAVSQTIEVTGSFAGEAPGVLVGMSGTAHFDAQPGG